MADSICGPSNALSSFQKHATVDRTLQQDRLIHQQSSQGFRSTPGAGSRAVDSEFEAFQAGRMPLESQSTFPPPQTFTHTPPPFLYPQQPLTPAWASDFQRLSLSSPSSQQNLNQTFTPPYTPQGQVGTGGWHHEFVAQHSPMSAGVPINSQGLGVGGSYQFSPLSVGMNTGVPMTMTHGPQTPVSLQTQPEEVYDDEAFARAFEEAARYEEEQTQLSETTEDQTSSTAHQELQQTTEPPQEILLSESAEILLKSSSDLLANQAPIGADTISSENISREEQEDPDNLARTAGQLLNSVRDNQSAKFQQSSFLALMRQFRDREVAVDGDKLVGGVNARDVKGDAEGTVGEVRAG